MFYWWATVFLAAALVAGVLGFMVLRAPTRGFAKALFYILLLAATIFGLLGLLRRSPPAGT